MSVAVSQPSSRRLAAAKLEEKPWAQKTTRSAVESVMYGIRVARVGIDSPLEHRARDVQRAGNDPIAPALVLSSEGRRGAAPSAIADERLPGSRRGAIRLLRLGEKLGRRSSQPRRGRLAQRVERNPDTARGRECGDDGDRPAGPERVGDEAGDERAGDEAEVAPEAVDADELGALDRLDDVGDGGDQGRVDERRPDARAGSRRRARREGAAAGDEERERARLDEHPGDDQRLAAGVVGEPAGRELAGAPDRRVDGGDDADLGRRSRRWRPGRAARVPRRARR